MNNEKNNQHREISLIDLWYIFRNNILFIALVTISIFSLVTIYTLFIVTPQYVSKADVMVQVEQDSSSNDPNYDLVNAFRLIDTIAELMEKDLILGNALSRLNNEGFMNVTVSDLRKSLSVNSSSTSYFINVSFVDSNGDLSRAAIDAVIDAVIEETDRENAFPVLTDKIRRTSFASPPEYHSPNRLANSILGFFVGLILSYGIVFLKETLSSHFVSKEEVESVLGIQVLGLIPIMDSKETKYAKK